MRSSIQATSSGALYLPLAGGTMTGAINFGNYLPTNIQGLARALFKGEVKAIPIPTNAGWTNTGVNGGSVVVSAPMEMRLRATTATGPNSTILARVSGAFGLNSNGASFLYVDWDKDLLVAFTAARSTSNANAVGFIQLKTATAIGELDALGIEFRIANLALYGNAYGSGGLGTEVNLSQSFTTGQPALLAMYLTSTGVEWFFNNVSKGTLTTATKFPTGMGGGEVDLCFSLDNGGTATQVDLDVGNIWIVQEV